MKKTNIKTDELTIEQKILECKKVAGSFRYFLDNYVYIEDKEAHTAIKLKLWPEQERIVSLITDSNLLIALKARQLGITWLYAAYCDWLLLVNQLYLIVVISTTEELSIEFLERVYFIHDRLPLWLKPRTKSRTKQTFELQHEKGLTSQIKSLPTTEMGAQSKTPNLLIMDETCKNRMSRAIFNSSYPGIEAAKGKVAIISNAIKEGAGWYFTRDMYLGSMNGMNKFKRIFLSWNANPNRQKTFIQDMIDSGMDERDVRENYPETEEAAIEDRNIKGVYYSKQMSDARKEGRICAVPYVQGFEVYTFWDLGIDDATSIWFMQHIGKQYRFIDYYENTGMSQAHYAKILKEKDYVYGDHIMPHDVAKRQAGGDADVEVALTLKEISENLGIRPVLTVQKAKDSQAVLNAIENGRNILGQCVFDAKKCARGILCLESYRAEVDEESNLLSKRPVDNFAIHGADSFRTFAEGYRQKSKATPYEVYRNYSYAGGLGYLGM